ncbi:MAG TPA: tetratricopeptide repeat protein [Candidatus Baltobacteraceae bacterium]|nr:tetratricopeptide repeat protein [Candidatus Baltobacteraceae bacterium]
MRKTTAILVLILAATAAPLRAQYQTPRPMPATTSVPALHEQAVARIVIERFHSGLAAIDRRDWAQARAEFAAVVALHPAEPQGSTADYDLALAQAHLGEYGDAAASLQRALTLDPAFLAAMANLVAVDLQLGNLSEARAIADRFVELAPDSARALYSRGLVALQSNDLASARDDFSKLLRNDPQYALAHYDLGVAESRAGSYAEAQREFSSALALAPTYARARFALGTLLLRSGNRSAARAAFERAASDAAGDPSLRALALQMRDAIAAPRQ